MDAHLLLDNFTTIADAPGGVPRLRELILELAVRGHLVPQDPTDEPASVLLEQISDKRAALRRGRSERRSRARRTVPRAADEFHLPDGWLWANIGDASVNRDSERIPLKREDRAAREGQFDYYGASGVIDHIDDYLFDGTYLLVGEDGANLRLRSTPIAFLASGRFWVNNHAHVLDSVSTTALKYLAVFLNSIDLVPYLTGTAQPKLNQARLNRIPVPLPPLAEQERIVAKVDELMERCDELETCQERRACVRTGLRTSALGALISAESPDALRSAWELLADNWPAITPDIDSVADLRRTILQLAVQGRLTEQLPADGNADGEIDEGKAGKESLRGFRYQNRIVTDEPTETLPPNWSWSSVDDLFLVTGGIQKSPKRAPRSNHFPYVGVANVQRGRLDLNDLGRFELFAGELEKLRLEPGDLLVVEGNGSSNEIGRCARWNGEVENCVHQNHLIRVRPAISGFEHFTLLYLNSPPGVAEMQRRAVTTSGLYNLSVSKVRSIAVPVPPLAEQKRIVTKVDELMTLCDQLEAGLDHESELRGAFAFDVAAQLTSVGT